MPGFRRRFYVDHCHLREFRDYLQPTPAGGDSVNMALLDRHVRHVLRYLHLAKARGATDYVLFSRGFEYLITYDALGVYAGDHPCRRLAAVFRTALTTIFDHGSALGLGMWFHTNQFEFPAEIYAAYGDDLRGTEQVCPGKELTWQLLRAKIQEFFRLFPQARGLQITASESQVPVLSCRCPACGHLSPADRIRKLIAVAHETASACGKECQVRPRSGLEKTAQTYLAMIEGLDPDCVIATKHTRSDYYISEPINPTLNVGHVQRAVEFDCWREWSGWNRFPCYMGDVFAARMREVHACGIQMVAARLDWSPEVNEIFDRPWGNIVNLAIFDRLAHDATVSPNALLREWLAETYGTRDTDALVRLYKLSYTLHHLAYSFLGHNCGDHSGVFRKRKSDDSVTARLESVLHVETCDAMCARPELLTDRLRQFDEAFAQARATLRQCRQHMPADWFAEMQIGLENTLSCAKVNTYLMLLYVHIRGVDCVTQGLPPVEWVRVRLRAEMAEWEARDAQDFATMSGHYAEELLIEAENAQAVS